MYRNVYYMCIYTYTNHYCIYVCILIGVWYNTRERFRSEIPMFLHYLNDVAGKDNPVFFRETAAQHW